MTRQRMEKSAKSAKYLKIGQYLEIASIKILGRCQGKFPQNRQKTQNLLKCGIIGKSFLRLEMEIRG